MGCALPVFGERNTHPLLYRVAIISITIISVSDNSANTITMVHAALMDIESILVAPLGGVIALVAIRLRLSETLDIVPAPFRQERVSWQS